MLQHGAYALLLDHLYSTEKPLPDDWQAIYRICSASTKREKNAAKYVTQNYLFLGPEGWSNKRVVEEIQYAESRRVKASKAAASRYAPSSAPRCATSSAPALRVPDSRLQTPENTKSKSFPQNQGELVGFAIFWEAYPKKVGREDARKKWLSKVMDDKAWPDVIAGLESWKLCEQWQDDQFIPYPAVFLGRKQWCDAAPPPGGSRERKIEQSIRESVELAREYGIGEDDLKMGDAPRPALQPARTLLVRGKENLH